MFCKYCGTPTETEVCPNCAAARGIQQPQYQAPQPQYQAPQPQYQAPQPQYQAPQPQYQAPQPQYQAPQPQYQAPQPQYQAPQPQYQAPQPQYQAPQPQYQAPQPQYQAPQPQYQAPQPQYQAPQPQYQAPQPQYQAPQQQYQGYGYAPQPQRRPAAPKSNKGWWHFVIAGVATLALIFGILTMFGVMDVYYSAGWYSGYHSVESFSDGFVSGSIGNILYGLISLAVAGVGVLYFLKKMFGISMYDDIIGKMLNLRPGVILGALGVTATLLQVILYLFSGNSYVGIGVNWISWVLLALYAGLIPVDMFLISKMESK